MIAEALITTGLALQSLHAIHRARARHDPDWIATGLTEAYGPLPPPDPRTEELLLQLEHMTKGQPA